MEIGLKENQRTSYLVNIVITVLVILMMVIYYFIGAKILAYYSVFVTAVYLLNFLFIYKNKLRLYIWATYTMLTLYMAIATVMLGYNYGFHLYSMSTIPLIFYVKYIAIKANAKDPKPVFWSVVIIISCILSCLYTVYHGPVYKIGGAIPIIFLGINTASVSSFLFYYSAKAIKLVIESENKLDYQANHDALTGLANRYSMRKVLIQSISNNPGKAWIAMIDIDNFKRINDVYGHNIGDEVLKNLARLMESVSADISISRWGGEEFLIFGNIDVVSKDIIEQLRKKVEDFELESGEHKIKFTITSGVSIHEIGQPMDKWIISADNKLYYGKENGKNQVVYN